MSSYREQLENTIVYGAMFNAASNKEYVAIDVIEKLKPNMFITAHARALFNSMLEIAKSGESVDMIKVYTLMKNKGDSVFVGNVSQSEFGQNIMDSAIFENEINTAIAHLRNEYFRQETEMSINMLASNSKTEGYSVSQLADLADDISGFLRKGECEKYDNSNSWDGYIQSLETDLAIGKRILATPWNNLNRVLHGGFEDFELIVVGARPSVGKTALLINMVNSVCSGGGCAAMFSLEVDNRQIRNRSTSCVSGVPFKAYREGLSRRQVDAVKSHVAYMKDWDFHIYDKFSYSVAGIRAESKKLKMKKDLRLIGIDYLQLMKPANSKDIREQQIAQISRDLKKLTKELNVPIVLLAQLNRAMEKETREPRVSDLRESGAIEQDADIILLLHEMKNADPNNKPVKAIVGKGRSSGKGVAFLKFNGSTQEFIDDMESSWKQTEVDREKSKDNGLS